MPDKYWWKTRRKGEETAVYLTRVLRECGPYAQTIADRAAQYWYDDFRAPEESGDMGDNMQRLVAALDSASRNASHKNRILMRRVIEAVKEGEFDGTREEARAWGQSPEGLATFNELLRPRRPKDA